jgi:hypothetical protein
MPSPGLIYASSKYPPGRTQALTERRPRSSCRTRTASMISDRRHMVLKQCYLVLFFVQKSFDHAASIEYPHRPGV